jgi:hypothetical protein
MPTVLAHGACAVIRFQSTREPMSALQGDFWAGDVLGDDHCDVLVLGVAGLLDVPVLDGADDVRLVGGPELDLDLVPRGRLGVLEEQVQATGPWLSSLLVFEDQVPEAEEGGVLRDALLQPLLGVLTVAFEADHLRLHVLHEAEASRG